MDIVFPNSLEALESYPKKKDSFPTRPVAIQFSYLGQGYAGVTYQPSNPNTVEDQIFKALRRTNLCQFEAKKTKKNLSEETYNIGKNKEVKGYEAPLLFASLCTNRQRGKRIRQCILSSYKDTPWNFHPRAQEARGKECRPNE